MDRLAAAACLAALVPLGGCLLRQGHPLLPPAANDPPAKATSASPAYPQSPANGSSATAQPGDTSDAGDRSVLARPDWIHAVADEAEGDATEAKDGFPKGDSPIFVATMLRTVPESRQPPTRSSADPQSSYRWRHPGLEELLARPKGHELDLRPYLDDKDRFVAINAAIGLARRGDASGAKRLADTVRQPDLRVPIRCAAVEALALLPSKTSLPALQDLADQYGSHQRGSKSAYMSELHAELVRGLGRHVDPADDPRLLAALRSPSADVRRAALCAWGAGRRGILPVEVDNLRTDSDPRVRANALKALAARRHPKLSQYLTEALHDTDIQVRFVAIAALGQSGDGQSQAALADLLKDRSDRIRADAVAALATSGSKHLVLGAASDPSWRVRLVVARALAAGAGREETAVAGRLLGDPSAEVQKHVVDSLARWPIAESGPLLLEAMGKSAFLVRKLATEQLALHWPPAAEFPVAGPQLRRAEVLAQLEERFRAEKSGTVTLPTAHKPTTKDDPAIVEKVRGLIERRDWQALDGIGPPLAGALETLWLRQKQSLPDAVWQEVLPRQGGAFKALARLKSRDVVERRQAAGELAALAQKEPLRPLAVARLSDLVAAETDELVWRSALEAIAADSSEPAARMAYAAIGHAAPEMRRRACEYLANHPAPAHAKILLPALDDTSHSVVVAALRAVGKCGPLENLQPLARMLAASNQEIQLETSVALARLDDPRGAAALDRMAASDDDSIRLRAAQAMGELADPSFVGTLVGLLDDRRPGVSRAALVNLPKVAGNDFAQTTAGPAAGTTEQVRRWKEWFASRPPDIKR